MDQAQSLADTGGRTVVVRSFEAFADWHSRSQPLLKFRANEELASIKERPVFSLDGYCAVCRRETIFIVDYQYSFMDSAGSAVPNWRERLECWYCRLNCRMRGAVHFLAEEMGCDPGGFIYITEQVTPMYGAVKERFPQTIGSEYLGDSLEPGSLGSGGVRHEDVTKLSFGPESFNYILSFDVLEHVPAYKKALSEFHRVLTPQGELLMTVPFSLGSPETATLATVENGVVHHLSEPEYHGDPLTGAVLCFYHFGWSFLDDVRRAGFRDVTLHLYWSKQLGYLGGMPFLIRAIK